MHQRWGRHAWCRDRYASTIMGRSIKNWGRHTTRVLIAHASTTGHSLGWNNVLMTGDVGWPSTSTKRASQCPATVVKQYSITLKPLLFCTRVIPFLIDGFRLGRTTVTNSTTSTASMPLRPTTLPAATQGLCTNVGCFHERIHQFKSAQLLHNLQCQLKVIVHVRISVAPLQRPKRRPNLQNKGVIKAGTQA